MKIGQLSRSFCIKCALVDRYTYGTPSSPGYKTARSHVTHLAQLKYRNRFFSHGYGTPVWPWPVIFQYEYSHSLQYVYDTEYDTQYTITNVNFKS